MITKKLEKLLTQAQNYTHRKYNEYGKTHKFAARAIVLPALLAAADTTLEALKTPANILEKAAMIIANIAAARFSNDFSLKDALHNLKETVNNICYLPGAAVMVPVNFIYQTIATMIYPDKVNSTSNVNTFTSDKTSSHKPRLELKKNIKVVQRDLMVSFNEFAAKHPETAEGIVLPAIYSSLDTVGEASKTAANIFEGAIKTLKNIVLAPFSSPDYTLKKAKRYFNWTVENVCKIPGTFAMMPINFIYQFAASSFHPDRLNSVAERDTFKTFSGPIPSCVL